MTPLFGGDDGLRDRDYLEARLSARRQAVRKYFAEHASESPLAVATACFALQSRVPEALRIYLAQLDQPQADPAQRFSLMAAYLHGRSHLPDTVHSSSQRRLIGQLMRRGRRELDWHFYYSTIFLAAQCWPHATQADWFNGKGSAENQREAADYLMQWLERLATQGQKEFTSPQSLPGFLGPLFTLYDFADDPPLRQRARMALDLLLAEFASQHLAGQYAGAHSHGTHAVNIDPLHNPASGFAWFLFGAGKMTASMELLLAALSSYEIPAVALGMGINRDESYVHRERKANPAPYRHTLAGALRDLRKYTYITRDYAIGSMTGALCHPYEQQSWMVSYANPDDRHPLFFATHPYAGDEKLGMFCPDPPRALASGLVTHDAGSVSPEKLQGGSPFETILQHRNVLMALYDIPSTAAHPWVNGFLSKDLSRREQLDDGWILCQMAQAFLAVKFLQPVELQEIPEGYRLTSRGRRNAVIVEAASIDDCPNFEEFKRRFSHVKVSTSKITVHSKVENKSAGAITTAETNAGYAKVIYRSTYGDIFEVSSSGERKLNGYPLAEATTRWPFYGGPFMKSDERSRTVLLRNDKLWRTLDFSKWEIRDVDGTFGAELTRKR
jgi:hypothetical protein